jgi:regulator of RNase E activity RraA
MTCFGDTMTKLNSGTREKLKNVSTATICTALFKRGLRNQFVQDVRPLKARRDNMVGEAFTLRYIPAREDLNPISVFEDRLHPQRKAVEDCPPERSSLSTAARIRGQLRPAPSLCRV